MSTSPKNPSWFQRLDALKDALAVRLWEIENLRPLSARLRSCYHPLAGLSKRKASYCGASLCPLCSRLKAETERCYLAVVLYDAKVANPQLRFYHATLTVQDTTTQHLRQTIDFLNGARQRLFSKTAGVVKHLAGWFRSLEVVPSVPQPDLENVHMHAVLAMRPGYSGRNYLSAADWDEAWEEAAPNSGRSINVRKWTDTDHLAAYVIKGNAHDFVQRYENGLIDLDRLLEKNGQLKGLKIYVYGGILQEGLTAQERRAFRRFAARPLSKVFPVLSQPFKDTALEEAYQRATANRLYDPADYF
jgi:hypothetical protein